MNNLAIIDLDSMLYQSTGADSIELCFEKFREKLNNCLVKTNADYWCGFVGKGKTFRHNIDPLYKSNRTQKPPKYLAAIKEWAIEEFNLNVCTGYEVDDAVAYWYNQKLGISEDGSIIAHGWQLMDNFQVKYELFNKILCAIDKDVLNSIPGKHFNYSYKIKEESKSKDKTLLIEDDFNKGWWVETNEVNIEKFKWMQVLMGDNSDGVHALAGVGIKTAEKWLSDIGINYPKTVLSRYISHYRDVSKAIFEFQKNYRLLHILNTDEDFLREAGSSPSFPIINKVEKQESINREIEF